jgi:hypothetical protein
LTWSTAAYGFNQPRASRKRAAPVIERNSKKPRNAFRSLARLSILLVATLTLSVAVSPDGKRLVANVTCASGWEVCREANR